MTLENILTKSEKLYRSKVTYFERPILSNCPYQYQLINLVNPWNFVLKIEDDITTEHEKQLKVVLNAYSEICPPGTVLSFPCNLFYDGMPALVRLEGDSSLSRCEVLKMNERQATINLIDIGMSTSTSVDYLLPVTIEVLRVPKIGFQCSLSHITPIKGDEWPVDVEKKKYYTGEMSQIVTFSDYLLSSKLYEVILEVDGVNVALKLFHLDLAMPEPLVCIAQSNGKDTYPLFDYSSWLGMKSIVYGLKLFQDEDKKIKCVLQMYPEHVNEIQAQIVEYVKDPANLKQFNLAEIVTGLCCLATYGGQEYYRAVVLKKMGPKILIEYVDYKDTAEVTIKDVRVKPDKLLKIPRDLVAKAEGSVVCQITDLLHCEVKDLDKLKAMVCNQDLYAVIDACDPEYLGNELLVSLYQPTQAYDGDDRSFSEILEIGTSPLFRQDILQDLKIGSQELGSYYLQRAYPNSNAFYPGIEIFVAVVDSWDSIWVQLNDEMRIVERISKELNLFYSNGGCDERLRESFLSKLCIGDFVAVKQLEESEIIWYRAKVVQDRTSNQQILVHFFDYGNSDLVDIADVYPLHQYFFKDPRMAFEMGFKK